MNEVKSKYFFIKVIYTIVLGLVKRMHVKFCEISYQ